MITALYVDDEPALLDIVKLFLEKTGNIQTITSDSSIQALEILRDKHIDVIISDFDMPIMNGIEFLIETRKAGFNIPFIIYTGKGRMEIVIQALEAGADSYIQKDGEIKVQFSELLEKIQKVVRWKIAEDEIKKKNREWEGIFQSIGEAVLIINPQYSIIAANHAACGLFGLSEAEIVGENCHTLFHGGTIPVNCPINSTKSSKKCESGEIYSETLSKTFIVGCTPILNDQGDIDKFIHISTDITEHKKIEEELQSYRSHLEELVRNRTRELAIAKEEAESANKAKSTFLSNMSHELRTPLNAILGYTQILSKNDNLTDIQIDQLNTVYTSGKHLLSLINDLLDLSKIEAQVIKIDERPFSLPDILREIYNIIRVKAEEKSLIFHYQQKTVIPDYILGDEAKIKQIFINILNNAVKYTKTGEIIFSVGFDFENGQGFWSEISDTGIGIHADVLQDIFKPFMQVGSKDVPVEGTGLGLAITKSLIEYMKGTINVQSSPGVGSTFRVDLPLQVTYSAHLPVTIKKHIVGYEGQRKKILVVDDNISNSELLESLLKPLDFIVYSTNNGNDAIRLVDQIKPDLILLDLVMVGMDGFDVLQNIRNKPEYDVIKIIGLSAAVSHFDLKHEFKGSCDAFLEKPINIDHLLDCIGLLAGLTWIEKSQENHQNTNTKKENQKNDFLLPDEEILKSIQLLARQGNFKKIKKITSDLEESDPKLKEFCQKIKGYSNRFDDDAIISFIKSVKGAYHGNK